MTEKPAIYLDNHATTQVDVRVLEAMMPYLTYEFGNPASRNHAFGWRAEEAVELARTQVATLIGASPKEIVFTSGATEADNLAIKGLVAKRRSKGSHIVTTQIEHTAVLDTCRRLESERLERFAGLTRLRRGEVSGYDSDLQKAADTGNPSEDERDPVLERWKHETKAGARVSYLGVNHDGIVDIGAIREAITDDTVLVSVMLANNEIGSIQPVDEIGEICHAAGVAFHCDAVQGVGKIPFSVARTKVDLVSISAHKMYGPKGVGALYVRGRPRVQIVPTIDGGGHERGMRSGTLNVAGVVGFGRACEIAREEMEQEATRVADLRDDLERRLFRGLDRVTLNGSREHRLPGNLNVSFASVEAEALMMSIKDVALSSGSACTSASLEPSYVLRACGVDEELAHSSIRFGVGRFNTAAEMEYVAQVVIERVHALRGIRHSNSAA